MADLRMSPEDRDLVREHLQRGSRRRGFWDGVSSAVARAGLAAWMLVAGVAGTAIGYFSGLFDKSEEDNDAQMTQTTTRRKATPKHIFRHEDTTIEEEHHYEREEIVPVQAQRMAQPQIEPQAVEGYEAQETPGGVYYMPEQNQPVAQQVAVQPAQQTVVVPAAEQTTVVYENDDPDVVVVNHFDTHLPLRLHAPRWFHGNHHPDHPVVHHGGPAPRPVARPVARPCTPAPRPVARPCTPAPRPAARPSTPAPRPVARPAARPCQPKVKSHCAPEKHHLSMVSGSQRKGDHFVRSRGTKMKDFFRTQSKKGGSVKGHNSPSRGSHRSSGNHRSSRGGRP